MFQILHSDFNSCSQNGENSHSVFKDELKQEEGIAGVSAKHKENCFVSCLI